MAHGSSSALRADKASPSASAQAAANDVYGSLSGLGAPKKFKKKPVLVLDPEELAKAHAMFQDAQAEILGAETPREERQQSTLLGLAPMDDEDAAPEDMGVDDETADDEDGLAVPSAEDVLKMTKGRAGMAPDDAALAAKALEDGFDEQHRIFPSLPVRTDEEIAAEESAERAAAMAAAKVASKTSDTPANEAAPRPAVAPVPDKTQSNQPAPVAMAKTFKITANTPPAAASPRPLKNKKPLTDAPRAGSQRSTPLPATPDTVRAAETPSLFERMAALGASPASLPSAKVTPVRQPEPMPNSSEEPREPAQETPPAGARPVIEPAAQTPTPETLPEPVDAQADAPKRPAETHREPMRAEPQPEPVAAVAGEETEDQIDWAALDAPEAPSNLHNVPAQAGLQDSARVDDRAFAAVDEDHDHDDDDVDGYAFMYASNPRGRINRVAAEGRQNNLRAKLVKERVEIPDERKDAAPSLWARIIARWQSLFR